MAAIALLFIPTSLVLTPLRGRAPGCDVLVGHLDLGDAEVRTGVAVLRDVGEELTGPDEVSIQGVGAGTGPAAFSSAIEAEAGQVEGRKSDHFHLERTRFVDKLGVRAEGLFGLHSAVCHVVSLIS